MAGASHLSSSPPAPHHRHKPQHGRWVSTDATNGMRSLPVALTVGRSGYGTGGLELDDSIPVEPQLQQDLVGLLGETGSRPRRGGGDVELNRVSDQFELAGLHQVFVGTDLRIPGRLQGVFELGLKITAKSLRPR